jgi:anti-sigma-K factor RskA
MSADIHGLSGAYAVDAVDADERAAFEEHLAQCPECQAEVASLREAAAGLSPLTETPPPPGLRDAVLSGISAVRPLPPTAPEAAAPEAAGASTPEPAAPAEPAPDATVVPLAKRLRHRTAWLVAAAAAVVLVLGGIVWNTTRPQPAPPLSATEQVLRASDAQRYEKTIDGARATVVRSPSLHRAVIVADNMPPAPAGKDYQLWFSIPGKGMVSAGLMPHSSQATLTVPLEGDASAATGVGITVEPAGGSPAPTSAPIALITLT